MNERQIVNDFSRAHGVLENLLSQLPEEFAPAFNEFDLVERGLYGSPEEIAEALRETRELIGTCNQELSRTRLTRAIYARTDMARAVRVTEVCPYLFDQLGHRLGEARELIEAGSWRAANELSEQIIVAAHAAIKVAPAAAARFESLKRRIRVLKGTDQYAAPRSRIGLLRDMLERGIWSDFNRSASEIESLVAAAEESAAKVAISEPAADRPAPKQHDWKAALERAAASYREQTQRPSATAR